MKGILHLSRNRNWESAGMNGHALLVTQKGFYTSFRRLSIKTHHSSRRHRRPRDSNDILLAFCVTNSHSLVVLPPFRHVFFLFTTALPPWQSRSRWNHYCGCHNHYWCHYSRHRVHRLCNRSYQYRFRFHHRIHIALNTTQLAVASYNTAYHHCIFTRLCHCLGQRFPVAVHGRCRCPFCITSLLCRFFGPFLPGLQNHRHPFGQDPGLKDWFTFVLTWRTVTSPKSLQENSQSCYAQALDSLELMTGKSIWILWKTCRKRRKRAQGART